MNTTSCEVWYLLYLLSFSPSRMKPLALRHIPSSLDNTEPRIGSRDNSQLCLLAISVSAFILNLSLSAARQDSSVLEPLQHSRPSHKDTEVESPNTRKKAPIVKERFCQAFQHASTRKRQAILTTKATSYQPL